MSHSHVKGRWAYDYDPGQMFFEIQEAASGGYTITLTRGTIWDFELLNGGPSFRFMSRDPDLGVLEYIFHYNSETGAEKLTGYRHTVGETNVIDQTCAVVKMP